MEWLRQLSRAIDYIEENLVGEISYDEAAKLACCSTYYFQRMFSYIAGISLSEYIRRRRMSLAAFELQTSNIKVMDIGMKYGYQSPTAFNRAFQSVHGTAPTAARTKGTMLSAYPRISFSITVTGGEYMRYRIEHKEAFRLAGVRTALKEDSEYNFHMVPKFWEKMLNSPAYQEICNLSDEGVSDIFGVSSYEDPQNIYYYIAARTDRKVPKGMAELEIPAATWVVFEGDDPYRDSVQSIFRRFLTEWLPFSNYEYAHLPDIEVFPMQSGNAMSGKAEVWVAVTKPDEEKSKEIYRRYKNELSHGN